MAVAVSWESLGMPGPFVGFVRNNDRLSRFLPRRPASVEELLASTEERRGWTGHDDVRGELAAALRDYVERHGAPAEALAAADALARPGTLAIVTGQQPGLFGGPLYVWHKIATALQLARRIRATPGAPEVVTVFWNHSDDHDWGEANHAFLLNPALDVQRVRLRLGTTGWPLSAIPVGTEVARALDETRDLLPATDRAAAELAALAPETSDDTLATLTSRVLLRHFGPEGLLVLDPAALPAVFREPLLSWHGKAEELRGVQGATSAELVDRGFDVAVDPESPFLFELEPGGKRRAVPDGADPPAAEAASPGVLLRSVWQDRLLPTLAYVAGPGEVSYLALARPIYARLGVAQPALVPRASLTHVSAKLAGYMNEWHLSLRDLERGAKPVEDLIATQAGAEEGVEADEETPEAALEELAAEFRERLRVLEPRVAEVDPNLCHPLSRIGSRTGAELAKFARKLGNQRRNLAGRFRQQARRLCGELMPRGRLQERVFPALPFLVRREDFVRALVDVADPFADAHLLVEDE